MGCPTVLVATSRFADFAREVSRGHGLAPDRIAVVEHPIGGIGEAAIRERASAAMEQLFAMLVKRET